MKVFPNKKIIKVVFDCSEDPLNTSRFLEAKQEIQKRLLITYIYNKIILTNVCTAIIDNVVRKLLNPRRQVI